MDTVQVIAGSEATLVELGSAMEIATIQAAYPLLTAALAQASPNPLVLDASQLRRVDAAALQMLASLCRRAHERGIPLQWRAVHPAVRQAAQLSGLEQHLFGPA